MIFVSVRELTKAVTGKTILLNLNAIKTIEDTEVKDYNGTRYYLYATSEENRFPWGSKIEDCLVKIGE